MMCRQCVWANDLQELGFSEFIFFHCYAENCECECHLDKEAALEAAKVYFEKSNPLVPVPIELESKCGCHLDKEAALEAAKVFYRKSLVSAPIEKEKKLSK